MLVGEVGLALDPVVADEGPGAPVRDQVELQARLVQRGDARNEVGILVVHDDVADFLGGHDRADVGQDILNVQHGARIEEHGFVSVHEEIGVAAQVVLQHGGSDPVVSVAQVTVARFDLHADSFLL